ncbi:VOC family protein [Candidatus Enterococcus willemsii]|uniref:Glyoxalase n=1 Tax=Candidatus Enterococcus willemsii TaxID=1857215 RepID=A0ABQ6YYW1_9ENTE|nr:VOC family protein [Enterococcus sp. CU12B]KAF1303030.1 glyoxalase [Enterococcus sp. CU12B]
MNRINLVCLGVQDLQASLAFYQQLGFQTTARADAPIVFFNNQGSKLELFPIEQLAKDINETNPPTISRSHFSGITLACNLKSQAEVDQMMTLVRKAGGHIAKEPQPTDWGGYSGYFQDLDGYYWEVAYGGDWQFDEQEMLIID